jgi:nondiscriminating glutamyl-tRNA synthetase
MVNFLSLLSWSSESGAEILAIERLVEEFSFERMSKSAAIFDMDKLDWMNGQYLRQMQADELLAAVRPFLDDVRIDTTDTGKLKNVLELLRESVTRLDEIPRLAEQYYQEELPAVDGEAISVYTKDTSQKVYWAFLRHLKNHDNLDVHIFRTIMKLVQKETGMMGKDLWMPIRVALTGQLQGPDLPKVAAILGREKCERYIRKLVD